MAKLFNKPKSSKDKIIQLSEISADGRARLLDMAYARLRFGFVMMPIICAIFAWYYHFEDHPKYDYRVIIWTLIYFTGFCLSLWLNKVYQQDKQSLLAGDMLDKWLPKIELIAVVHGFGVAVLLLLVKDTASIEFKYLYLAVMAAIIAGNATHQSPMLSVFHRFLAASWNLTVLLFPWTVSSHWQFMMPLGVMYSIGMYRYSLTSHRFFVRMVWLEEEGTRLAASFKAAKESAENAKEIAEQALKDKNQFLTTASHDLRQPVHAMGFLIESIARRNHDSAIEPALKDLKQSVRSVTQMFNSLLDLSKIESGKVELRLGNVYLDALIQEIATVFSEEARAKNLEIRIRPSGGNAIGRVDGTLLHQSIMNLMHNALRYTKQGGMLIAIRKRGKDWQIDVWDTGIGVAIEDQDRIYSPFYRNEHAWRIDSAGHGLGLSVVARCCEMMDCQYGFSSRLHRGSHFWLRVPALTGRLPSLRIVNETKQQENSRADIQLSGTCLIVDDDPQVVSAWETLLNTWGVEVQCVESGKQAFEVIAQGFNPKVILCDQRLRAGESGFDILRALLAQCPAASGAMVSGEFDSPELKLAETEGYLVLHKPLEPDQLHAMLLRWLV